MRVLVTGGTGYIGRHVINSLLDRPGVSIVATTTDLAKTLSVVGTDRVEWLEVELSSPKAAAQIPTGNTDALIHLAWGGLPNYRDAIHIDHNLVWNRAFLTAMIEAGINNLCVTGTCLEYGMREGRLSEDLPAKPNNPYAAAKVALFESLLALQKRHAFSLKWLRLFYTFGEGQSEKSLMHQLDTAIRTGATSFDMSGGQQVRDFMDVRTMAERIVSCALQTEVEGVINCCSGNPVAVQAFVENFLKDRNCTMDLNLGVYPYPDYEPMAFWGDTRKLISALNCELL
jgi:nucleoside-diphosphate-sugar epimerase